MEIAVFHSQNPETLGMTVEIYRPRNFPGKCYVFPVPGILIEFPDICCYFPKFPLKKSQKILTFSAYNPIKFENFVVDFYQMKCICSK